MCRLATAYQNYHLEARRSVSYEPWFWNTTPWFFFFYDFFLWIFGVTLNKCRKVTVYLTFSVARCFSQLGLCFVSKWTAPAVHCAKFSKFRKTATRAAMCCKVGIMWDQVGFVFFCLCHNDGLYFSHCVIYWSSYRALGLVINSTVILDLNDLVFLQWTLAFIVRLLSSPAHYLSMGSCHCQSELVSLWISQNIWPIFDDCSINCNNIQ